MANCGWNEALQEGRAGDHWLIQPHFPTIPRATDIDTQSQEAEQQSCKHRQGCQMYFTGENGKNTSMNGNTKMAETANKGDTERSMLKQRLR